MAQALLVFELVLPEAPRTCPHRFPSRSPRCTTPIAPERCVRRKSSSMAGARCGRATTPVWISTPSPSALRARARARRAACRRSRSARSLQPVFGALFAVKDNIDVAGLADHRRVPGVRLRAAERTRASSQRSSAAGAIVVGKTNLDQFATGLVGTRSPYGAVPQRVRSGATSRGGSSSGSAVAVATRAGALRARHRHRGLGPRARRASTTSSGSSPRAGCSRTRGVRAGLPLARLRVGLRAHGRRRGARASRVARRLDAADPCARALAARPPRASRRHSASRVPRAASSSSSATARPRRRSTARSTRLEALGGTPREIDFAPLARGGRRCSTTGRGWPSATPASARSSTRNADALDPTVRGIIARRAALQRRPTSSRAQTRLRDAAAQLAPLWDGDRRAGGADRADAPTRSPRCRPSRWSSTAASARTRTSSTCSTWRRIAVPAGMRADGLPFGITLIGPRRQRPACWPSSAQRFHHATGLPLGATGVAAAAGRARSRRARRASLQLAVVGAHLSGHAAQPRAHRARRAARARARAPRRAIASTRCPAPRRPSPGCVRVGAATARAIEVEVWELPPPRSARFVAGIPAPLSHRHARARRRHAACRASCAKPPRVAGAEDIIALRRLARLPRSRRRDVAAASDHDVHPRHPSTRRSP